ncbi:MULTISPECIES: dTDP-4-dehydrorhamnose 3,5-epimerase [Vitreoscilla]|uniref:dTDP-4-dehydrorhamnose 3,5-epimerase n=1 Tax=Vitreoscilla stercoraria TaxID=61 RepID=A0ABY4EF97_VITST|nr:MULTISPECIES: dTDP-4-dehydrorhamnose 3,5-epimerase [Vitreoscilla]AUZ04153.1 dTDP-4-dehydrorhamnose 3,5-epimerase [Vitreoscilla sp. C1]UOO92082.1 dTDP-4-dehydrorhamnose 3,5-epimerase [Vitreoscilla stercoraria]
MKITQTFFGCVHLIDIPRYQDERGWFSESQHQQQYASLFNMPEPVFVQSNISQSKQNVLRGLHTQINHPQGKLIQVLQGKIYDVFVDIRPQSAHFKQWQAVVLDSEKSQQLWIPPGFAHGFLSLAENTTILYHCTNYYAPNDQLSILWDDNDLDIDWPLFNQAPVMSEKDLLGMSLKEFVTCVS